MNIVQEFKRATTSSEVTFKVKADGAYRVLVHSTPTATVEINSMPFTMQATDAPWALVQGVPGCKCFQEWEVTLASSSGAASVTFILERFV